LQRRERPGWRAQRGGEGVSRVRTAHLEAGAVHLEEDVASAQDEAAARG